MIEGIVVVNDLSPPRATRVRTELWEEVMGRPAPPRAPRRRRLTGVSASGNRPGNERFQRQLGLVGLDAGEAVAVLEQRHDGTVGAVQDADPADLTQAGDRPCVGAPDRLVPAARISAGALNSLARRWPKTSNWS